MADGLYDLSRPSHRGAQFGQIVSLFPHLLRHIPLHLHLRRHLGRDVLDGQSRAVPRRIVALRRSFIHLGQCGAGDAKVGRQRIVS